MATAKKVSEKYIDLISQGKKESDAEQNGFIAEEARLEVEGSIHETKKAIAAAKRKLNEAKKAIPYSLEGEVKATQALTNLEDGLKVALAIQKARF